MVTVSLSEAGRMLGVDRGTVADLMRALQLRPVKHQSNGRAKGVTTDQIEVLRRRLRPVKAQSA